MSQQQFKSEEISWCDAAAELLATACHDCHIDDLKHQVLNGAILFKLSIDDDLIGYYILRVDHFNHWSEAVFVAGAGNHPKYDITTCAVIIAEKQFTNCKFLRIHTARAGLAKKISKLGYKPLEIVMIKEL